MWYAYGFGISCPITVGFYMLVYVERVIGDSKEEKEWKKKIFGNQTLCKSQFLQNVLEVMMWLLA